MRGSAGSGKSVDTAQQYILRLMADKGRNLLCVRKSDVTNRDSTFAELQAAIFRMEVGAYWSIRQNPLMLRCCNGNEVIFRGVNDDKQREKLKSITVKHGKLTDVWIEEMTELTQDDFEIIDDRLRGELPQGLFYQIKGTFNPVSSASWVKRVFFDHPDANTLLH
ncbi:MAG: PBSX family phage terminase large subunit, partial [Ruthenibacterium sp.]